MVTIVEVEDDNGMLIKLATEAEILKLENVGKTIYLIKASTYDENVKRLIKASTDDLKRTYAFLLATTVEDPRVARLKMEGLRMMVVTRIIELMPMNCMPCNTGKAFYPERGKVRVREEKKWLRKRAFI